MNDERTSYDVWGAAIALQAALAMLLGLVLIFLWGLTGAGYFWPKWVLFGLAVPLAIQLAVRLALRVARRSPPGARAPWRGLGLGRGRSSSWSTCWPAAARSGRCGRSPPWRWRSGPTRSSSPRCRACARRSASSRSASTSSPAPARGALDVQAAELRRIERDLHDGAQARLVALSMQLGRAEERLEDHPEVAELVRSAREEAGAAIGELRDLARGIAPPVLADRGLRGRGGGARASAPPIPVTVDTRRSLRRPLPVVETAAYFVVAEALTNAAKHAGGAAARVELADHGDRLVVEVARRRSGRRRRHRAPG